MLALIRISRIPDYRGVPDSRGCTCPQMYALELLLQKLLGRQVNHRTDGFELRLGSTVLRKRFKVLDKRTVGSVKPLAYKCVGVQELGISNIGDYIPRINEVLLSARAYQFLLGHAAHHCGGVDDMVK